MDFTNPITLIFALPVAFLVFFLLRELFGTKGGSARFTSGLFSIEKEDDVIIKQKLDNLLKEVEGLKSKILYIESKDSLKYEYKGKLGKITKKFYAGLVDMMDEVFEKRSGYSPLVFRALDEYRIMILTMDQLTYFLTKKGMDDFDKNGFNKIGLDANGEYDTRIQLNYIRSKTEEYVLELKKLLNIVERPTTIPESLEESQTENPIDRKVLVPSDEFEANAIKVIRDMDQDIQDLYDFIITRYRTIDNTYQEGLGNDKK